MSLTQSASVPKLGQWERLELLKEIRECGKDLVFSCDVAEWPEAEMYLNRIIKAYKKLRGEAKDNPPKIDIDQLLTPTEARA